MSQNGFAFIHGLRKRACTSNMDNINCDNCYTKENGRTIKCNHRTHCIYYYAGCMCLISCILHELFEFWKTNIMYQYTYVRVDSTQHFHSPWRDRDPSSLYWSNIYKYYAFIQIDQSIWFLSMSTMSLTYPTSVNSLHFWYMLRKFSEAHFGHRNYTHGWMTFLYVSMQCLFLLLMQRRSLCFTGLNIAH